MVQHEQTENIMGGKGCALSQQPRRNGRFHCNSAGGSKSAQYHYRSVKVDLTAPTSTALAGEPGRYLVAKPKNVSTKHLLINPNVEKQKWWPHTHKT